ncbi:MAG: VCBS repeat-containing protein [Chitinophagaceae bacterium]
MKATKLFTYLLTLVSIQMAGCREELEKPIKEKGPQLFTLLNAEQTKIDFQNTLTEGLNTNILMYEYFYNGGGIATGDFNNDGLVDLYFTSNMSDNKMYLNKGNLVFEDITLMSNAAGRPGPWKTGVNTVDINADGKLDIYLCYSGALPPEKRANQLFINLGNNEAGIPRFEEKAAAYGLASTGFSNQSYFLDYDKDGDLDMLLLNHNPKNLPLLNEEGTAALFKQDNPEKGLRLFKQTKGTFEDVTTQTGINGSELSYGLGIGISDFNEDGWADFYVSNDYSVPDFLYINNKNGTFTNKLEISLGHTSQFSMGNDVADINNDGHTDIYTLDMLPEDNHRQKLLLSPDNYAKFNLNVKSGFYFQYMRNMLQLNNGNNTFSETGQVAGISNTDWSWSALFADYDNDGWKDLYVTNGYFRDYTNLDFINYMNEYVQKKGRLQRDDVMEIVKEMPSSNVVNYIFKNDSLGTFSNKTTEWGVNNISNSNGAVYADLDNDGDLDLVVNNINQPAFIYRNEAQSINKNNFLQIQLLGAAGNTMGLGAKVSIYYNGLKQMIEQNPARGYLSAVSYNLHVGLGNATNIDSLFIEWISGKKQKLYNIHSNQLIKLNEQDAVYHSEKIRPSVSWFSETTPIINYRHNETELNDFNRQSLLISQHSHNGPRLVKYDLNNDHLEDILIGGNSTQSASIFLQQKNKSFVKFRIPAIEADKGFEDIDIAVFDANGDQKADIYIASGGYHNFNSTDTLLQDRLYLNDGNNNFIRGTGLPKMETSTSCVRVQDINGDGFIDIFVGSRVIPGRYPEPPTSYILINDGKGNFSDQTELICPELRSAGMVTDAAWIDLDLDNKNELVLVGEWMPLTVYSIQKNKLVNVSSKYFENNYAGWWNNITIGDFNGDKKPDLLIGNIGLNTQFRASETEPLEMYYKDFDNNGSIDPIFSCYIQHKRYPYLTREELLNQLGIFRPRFPNFKSYADITMNELFQNNELKGAGHLVATNMETSCFLSSASGKFKLTSLPKEVQYSPVYNSTTLDFNQDGNTDLLLCGNNSWTKIRLGKFDANYGFLLEGDGKGNFTCINQAESGFSIRGDVRSCINVNETFFFGINGKSMITYKMNRKKK